MKIFITLLLSLITWCAGAQLIYETVWVDYDSALEYKSMQIVPIRPRARDGQPGPGSISLGQAIRQGMATISERGTASTENVHWLRINNKSDQTIFVASGQLLTGGRQDRMITKDTLLIPTGTDQYIPVMCVEEGRWSQKERKILYGDYANLRLRKVLDRTKNQALIWKEIFAQLDSADFQSPSLAYASMKQDKHFSKKESEYVNYFLDRFKRSDSSIVGFVCITGSRIVGCDIFADKRMFFDELQPLLAGYINDVLTEGSEPFLDKTDIKVYMDQILTNETLQDQYCKKNGKIFRAGNKVIHLTAY